MKEKEILDIENVNEEFKKLSSRLHLLYDRFLAIAMDYKYYIDSSFEEKKIYELRDNVQYRFFSAKFHVELLLNHQIAIIKQLEDVAKKDTSALIENFQNPSFDFTLQRQISSLFDSFIYHMVSVFDYISTLINYICGDKKENTLMWTQLAKSVRDKNNSLGKKLFAEKIVQIDSDFVNKLYDHRDDNGKEDYELHLPPDDNK